MTARSTDTLTIVRAKGGTTAKSFEAGDIVSNGIYIENSVAVGDIFMSLRATPEAGRLFMDGGTYSKADYPLMYKCVQDNAAYGTTGGSSGSETFTLADMRERMPFGKSSNSPFTTLGATGGTVSETLSIAQIPSHNHTMGSITLRANAGALDNNATNLDDFPGSNGPIKASNVQVGNAWNGNMGFTGGGGSHNNMSPYMVINYEVICG